MVERRPHDDEQQSSVRSCESESLFLPACMYVCIMHEQQSSVRSCESESLFLPRKPSIVYVTSPA